MHLLQIFIAVKERGRLDKRMAGSREEALKSTGKCCGVVKMTKLSLELLLNRPLYVSVCPFLLSF